MRNQIQRDEKDRFSQLMRSLEEPRPLDESTPAMQSAGYLNPREHQPDSGADTLRGLDLQPAAGLLDEALDHRQAEAGALVLSGVAPLGWR